MNDKDTTKDTTKNNKLKDSGWNAISTGSCTSISVLENNNSPKKKEPSPRIVTGHSSCNSDSELKSNSNPTLSSECNSKTSNRSSEERKGRKLRNSISTLPSSHSSSLSQTTLPNTERKHKISPRKNSHHTPHYTSQYTLWILDLKDSSFMPITKVFIGDVGRCSLDIIKEEIQKYNLNIFLIIEAEDANKLDNECDGGLGKMLSKLQITPDLVYLANKIEPISLTDKINYFFELMEKYSVDVTNNNVCIFGINTTSTVYVLMVCFWMLPTFKYIINKNHKIKLVNEFVPIQDIINNRLIYLLSIKPIINHVLTLVYQLVMCDYTHYTYISEEEKCIIEEYCHNIINNHINH